MNWIQRVKICENQVYSNNRFGNASIGGVKVKDENSNEIYLNQHPKTDWNRELEIAKEKSIPLYSNAQKKNKIV